MGSSASEGTVASLPQSVGRLVVGDGLDAEGVAAALTGLAEAGARVVVIEIEAAEGLAGWTGERVRWLWRDYPLPAVCAFEGRLAGGAAVLALGCDIRVCGEGAVVELAGLGGEALVAARARTLLGLGEGASLPARLTAGEALERGVVSRVGASGGAGEVARGAAEAVAGRGPIATRLAKEAVWRGLAMPLEQGLRFETDLTLLLQATKDRAEGVQAFLEKRAPNFRGE